MDTQQAALNLVCEAYRLWLQSETRTDDITAIVIRIDELDKPDVTANIDGAAVSK